jgi:hypothetical protein
MKMIPFLIMCLLAPACLFAQTDEPGDGGLSSEGLEMIEARMKSLSGSLGEMPEAPKFEGRIQLPGIEPEPAAKPPAAKTDLKEEKES